MLIRIEHSEQDLHRRYLVVQDDKLGRRATLARLTRIERKKGKPFHGLRLLTVQNICDEFRVPAPFGALLEEASRNPSASVRWVIDFGDVYDLHPNRSAALRAYREALTNGAYNLQQPPSLVSYPLFVADYPFPSGTDGAGNAITDVMHYLALHTMSRKEQAAFEEFLTVNY